MDVTTVALILSVVANLFAVGRYVAGKTKNKVDDVVFSDKAEEILVPIIEKVLAKKAK